MSIYKKMKLGVRYLLLILTCGQSAAWAQKLSLNDGWAFTRLSDTTAAQWTVGQQGSDWSSQFNIQHAEGTSAHTSLALSDSLVQAEAAVLARTARWEQVSLPHTAFVEDYVIRQPWQGICYYKRRLSLSPAQAAGQVWIEFEGAMQLADIWINGRHAAQHAGGFTTFVVDGTGLLRAGDNELVVRLDNRDNPLIPPGKPLGALDFCYHSGLYRDVNLICKGHVHLTHPLLAGEVAGGGIFVTYPAVSKERAEVKVKAEVANASPDSRTLKVRHTLFEWTARKGCGKAVARGEIPLYLAAGQKGTPVQTLAVSAPRLWSPSSPHLYVLRTEVIEGHKVLDTEDTRIGIRRFEMTREGCYVNGERVYLEGTNRHQEYPYVGNAISDRAQWRDAWQMRCAGFNTVRLGHYPQDPAMLDACDELGLLAIEPIPGWQFYNKDSLFIGLTYESIRELIRRDRNHPSILLWETTLNEAWPPTEWKDGAVSVAHAEMPDGQCFTSGDSYGYSGFDVCYNDWRDADFSRPNNSTKPGFIREYYDYEFGGHYSTSRVTRGDGERALRQNLWNAQWSLNSNRTRSNATMGGAIWSMYDYNRGCCDNICYSGVADLFRLPKYSLHFYRSQLLPGSFTPDGPARPEVFLASRWDASSTDTVVVLGNVAEVALKVNGREVARQKPDSGPDTPYTPRPDGGNCSSLSAPPFTFTGVTFVPGCIEAVGYDKSGHRVARAKVYTPAAPHRLKLGYFEGGLPAGRNDLLIVYATLLDERGVPCHTNGEEVRLRVVAGGEVAGPDCVLTEAGIASFLVHTADAPHLRLDADWAGRHTKWQVKLTR